MGAERASVQCAWFLPTVTSGRSRLSAAAMDIELGARMPSEMSRTLKAAR